MRVFARLRQDHGDLHLVICGRPGETTQELTQMVGDLGLDGHVTRLGYTEHVHHVVAHADLFVFPSLMEGLGTALLEAMSIGTPIVAFDIPPVSETVGGHGAILVPLLDEDALYEACGRLLGDERAHTRQAALGRDRVTSSFSIDAVAARVESLLRILRASVPSRKSCTEFRRISGATAIARPAGHSATRFPSYPSIDARRRSVRPSRPMVDA